MPSNNMLTFQLIVLCVVPWISAENGTRLQAAVLEPKHVLSGDLPEDYHMATSHPRDTASQPERLHFMSNSTAPIVLAVLQEQVLPSIANARSFSVDSKDGENAGQWLSTTPTTTTSSLKPFKIKKKILVSRPKTSTEKMNVVINDEVEVNLNKTDDLSSTVLPSYSVSSSSSSSSSSSFYVEPSTGPAEDNHFESLTSTTTDSARNLTSTLSTSSLLVNRIEKLVNNNLLNVIDSVKSLADETTEPVLNRVEAKVDEFGAVGQTDWVPLISSSTASDWSPFIPKVTTEEIKQEGTTAWKRPEIQRPFRFPDDETTVNTVKLDNITSNIVDETQIENATVIDSYEHITEMDVATTSKTALNATNPIFVSFVKPLNNTLKSRLKENIQSAFSRATERYKSENVTKEHNQVLKNTIADTLPVQTTPFTPKWKPLVTVPPPIVNQELPHTSTQSDETITEQSEVEQTEAFEVMKVTTQPPAFDSSTIKIEESTDTTDETTEEMTTSHLLEESPSVTQRDDIDEMNELLTEPTTFKIPFETIATVEMNPTTLEPAGDTHLTGDGDHTSDDLNQTTVFNEQTYVTDELTEENVPAYLRLTVKTSEIELCHLRTHLISSILKILSEGTNTTVGAESLVLLNLTPSICEGVSASRPEDSQMGLRPVNMFLMDEQGDFNKNLSEAFLRLWGEAGLDFPLPILKVDFVTPIPEGDMDMRGMSGGVVAAIVISSVAGLCLILLGLLFVVMKRRQKTFNYGQRCTPVSLDAYSLDSVSIRASGRRKGIHASKRSYGNPAFDDPEVPSHPVNFAGLANFSQERSQLDEEFAVIPQVSPRADELPPGAETRNRYANVIPLPETRVTLSIKEGDPNSDYINANFVKGLKGSTNMYIAAQAPLDETLCDWWRMVWEHQVKLIIQLTALQENQVEKCADYLPSNEVTDNVRLFGDFQVTLKKRDQKDKYVVSVLHLKNMESSLWREITHMWYVGWPDTGVPSETTSLTAMLISARSHAKVSSPTLVHCSPGTGRTGTVIACDLLLREYEHKRLVDIPRCVYHLRRARAGAVQTRDQYAFIYQMLNAYATKLTGAALDNI